jgi:hypothetical protein
VRQDVRTRTIAPGFWKNPELARCDAYARLMFAALWGLADRSGRLEDRPERIRAEAFPFEPAIDPDALLWQLHRQGLAVRYVTGAGQQLVEIPRFNRYQRPYTGEPPSELPASSDPGCSLRIPQSETNSRVTRSNTQELRLSTVSCLLSPFSLLLAEEEAARDVKQLAKSALGAPAQSNTALKGKPKTELANAVAASCPHELIRRIWREELPRLPAPREPWTSTNARYLRARWREEATTSGWTNVGEGLKWFHAFFAYVGRSRFLTGRTGPRRTHETPFEVTLEWLVKLEHWSKVQQGQYHDRVDGAMQ